MEDLKKQLVERGVSASKINNLDEKTIKSLGEVFGLKIPRDPVMFIETRGVNYVKTASYKIPHSDPVKRAAGKTQQSPGIRVPITSLDEAIEELMLAKLSIEIDGEV